ncbi:beta-ketoacyl synthase chain length factor [Acidihalobacter prosperus]
MTACSILGTGLYAPGLESPTHAAPVLRGERAYEAAPLAPPQLDCLPRNERRRTTPTIRLALAAAQQATAELDAAKLATVFATSSGDMPLVDTICTTLASTDRALSPTLFHNSVHNAPAGYWSIATHAHGPSSSLGAYDASFACGLLEAAVLSATENLEVLFVAYDLAMPEPVHRQRLIDADFAMALVLGPPRDGMPRLKLERAESTTATPCADPGLEHLRTSNPAARSLPLLAALADGSPRRIVLPYLEGGPGLAVTCTPA